MTQLNTATGGSPYNGQIGTVAGSAANPGLAVGAPTQGIYSTGTGNLSVAANGAQVLTVDSTGIGSAGITATATPFPITGLAGSGTGNGGVVALAGGASGTGATGDGGAATHTGGAALSTNGNGGLASLVGGAGAGTGAGGAINIISGAAGSTGVAGAIAIAVGAATAGNGSNIAITGGNGAGGTASGGNINLVPGTAVSTGTPGEVQFNGSSGVTAATYFFTGTPAATNQAFFVAPRAMRVKTMSCVFSTAAGGVSTLDVTKDTGTTAPGAGTSLFGSGSFNLNATANTVQNATVSTTVATVNLAAGDRLSVKFNNTIQSSAGIVVTVMMTPI